MPPFDVFAGSTRVGCSELEHGDPPMGVAAGRFLPGSAYAAIQNAVIASREGSQIDLALRVLAPDGRELASDGQVQIIDYTAELGTDALEVHVIGIEPGLYAELFHAHIAAFEAMQSKSG